MDELELRATLAEYDREDAHFELVRRARQARFEQTDESQRAPARGRWLPRLSLILGRLVTRGVGLELE